MALEVLANFKGLGSAQFVIAGLLLATAYVVYVVLLSIDPGYRLTESARSSSHAVLKMIAFAALHLSLIIALFLAPPGDGKDPISTYLMWAVATFASAYAIIFIFINVHGFIRYKSLVGNDVALFKDALQAVTPKRLDAMLRAARVEDGVRVAIVDAVKNTINARALLEHAAVLRDALAQEATTTSPSVDVDAYAAEVGLVMVATSMVDTVPQSAVSSEIIYVLDQQAGQARNT